MLEDVLAHHEITRLLHLSCRGLDRRDEGILREVYHPDAVHSHGELWTGSGHDYARNVAGVDQPLNGATGQHHITNMVIKIAGACAVSESYYLSMHNELSPSGNERDLIILGGRFLDRLEQRVGVWGITSRQVVLDWSHRMASGKAWDQHEQFSHGSQLDNDPSKSLFQSLESMRSR